MTTLAEVAAAMLPGARVVSAPAGEATPVTWVRVMRARVPAFDALEPGDIAIVPAAALAVVAPGLEELQALADACTAARVAGLLLIESEGGEDAAVLGTEASDLLDGLGAALEGLGVPAYRVPRADLAALERSLIGYLVSEGAELDRQASLLEGRLEQFALSGGGPTAMLGAVATFLGRAVALEGRRGNAIAVHAPPEASDGAAAVARYHARPRHAVALRIPLPTTGGAAGSLALLGERPVGELERVSVARIAGLLALELSREEAVRKAQDQARRAEALPTAGPPWVVLIARQRTPGGDDDAPDARERREAVRRDLRLLAPARRLALRGDAASLEIRAVLAVEGAGDDPDGLSTAGQMADFLGRTVSVSMPFSTPIERPTAEGDARTALEATEALPDPPAVAQAARLPAYRLVGALHSLPDGARLAAALLAPLLSSRPDVRAEHLATLRALLDHGGVNETAAALGVHRNTVAYRLRRIETITGWHLADPELRLPLAVALRLVQND
ncbi:MAG: helix-turn-helix domain-containing protein [Chloroflexota bacterium]